MCKRRVYCIASIRLVATMSCCVQVMGDIQKAMNTKDVVALGRALKEAERLNIDEVSD